MPMHFSCAFRRMLLFSSAIAVLAASQSASAQSAAKHRDLSFGNVDLTHGDYQLQFEEGSIGAGQGQLKLIRQSATSRASQWDNIVFQKTRSGGVDTVTVLMGRISETWTGTPGNYTSISARGNVLTGSGPSYSLSMADGTTILFGDPTGNAYSGATNFCKGLSQSVCSLVPVSITAPNGQTTNLTWETHEACASEFNPDGSLDCTYFWRLAGVSNVQGNSISFSYVTNDPVNYQQPVANWYRRAGASFGGGLGLVSYTYPSSDVIDVTDMSGSVWRFTAQNGLRIRRPTSATDTTVVTYSGASVTSVVQDGVTTSYSRTVSGNTGTMVVTHAGGGQTTVVSNLAIGRPTSSTDPLGRTTSWAYDANGRLTRTTTPDGSYTELTLDSRGNVTQAQRVAKPGSGSPTLTTSAVFPASCSNPKTCNQPTSTTDARGAVTDYTYDPNHGGILTVTAPAAPNGIRPQTRYTYTTTNGVVLPATVSSCQTQASCIGTADEQRTTITYNAALLPSTVTAASGDGALSSTTAATYDAIGNLLTVDGPLAGAADTTRYRYGPGRRLVGVVGPDPDGGGVLPHVAQRFTYNADGQVTKSELGMVMGQSDALWSGFSAVQEVATSYDGNARKVREVVQDATGPFQVTQLSYDARGRLNCTAVRMNSATWGSLPASACTLGAIAAEGPDRITKLYYDVADQVTYVQEAHAVDPVNVQALTYTPNGQVATVADGESNLTTYEYDGHSRLVKTRFPVAAKGANTSSTTDYEELTLDANGNVTQRRLRDGSAIGFTYDALNRVATKDLPSPEYDVSYTYDLQGRLTATTQWWDTITFSYDALGRQTSVSNFLGTTSYQYDAAGRRTRLTWPDGFFVTYEYWANGALTTIRENGGSALVWFAYDGIGRRGGVGRANGTQTTYSYDGASRLSQLVQDPAGTAQDLTLGFTYNPASQIATNTRSNDSYAWTGHYNVTRPYTANGLNQYTASGAVTPTYDGRGNLTSAGGPTFGYKAENQLATVSGIGGLFYDPLGRLYQTSAAQTTMFGYDGADMISEYSAPNQLIRRYVHGPGADEPLVWYEGSGTGDRRFLHADERGSIIAVTNNAGASIAINSYDEYGIPGANNQGRFQYTGQAWLPEFGLYHYKARAYAPTLGRFLQTDPIGYGDGMNMYAYVGGDPVNATDPSGMQKDPRPSNARIDPTIPPGDQKVVDGGTTVVNGRPPQDFFRSVPIPQVGGPVPRNGERREGTGGSAGQDTDQNRCASSSASVNQAAEFLDKVAVTGDAAALGFITAAALSSPSGVGPALFTGLSAVSKLTSAGAGLTAVGLRLSAGDTRGAVVQGVGVIVGGGMAGGVKALSIFNHSLGNAAPSRLVDPIAEASGVVGGQAGEAVAKAVVCKGTR